jgi:hypothetical protein
MKKTSEQPTEADVVRRYGEGSDHVPVGIVWPNDAALPDGWESIGTLTRSGEKWIAPMARWRGDDARRALARLALAEEETAVFAEAKAPALLSLTIDPEFSGLGYLRIGEPGGPGSVARTVELRKLLDYDGPPVNLDLAADGRLLGIEVVG